MRITFLVGNGFDLNCGLHTQYSDFYKYFIEKHPQNTIACEIADNPENWADLELSIGKYIEKVSGENRETFLNDLAELEEELRDYLQSENQRIVIGNEIGGEFHDKVVCFLMECAQWIRLILQICEDLPQIPFNIPLLRLITLTFWIK